MVYWGYQISGGRRVASGSREKRIRVSKVHRYKSIMMSRRNRVGTVRVYHLYNS